MDHPYIEEKISQTEYIRTFSVDTPEEYFKWHWDEEDRIIESIEKTDWQFQFDNQFPIDLNQRIYIPKGLIHRIIKGTGNLKIKIIKK